MMIRRNSRGKHNITFRAEVKPSMLSGRKLELSLSPSAHVQTSVSNQQRPRRFYWHKLIKTNTLLNLNGFLQMTSLLELHAR